MEEKQGAQPTASTNFHSRERLSLPTQLTLQWDASLAQLNTGETSRGIAQTIHKTVGNNKLSFYAVKFQGCLLPEKTKSVSKVLSFLFCTNCTLCQADSLFV